MRLSLDLTNDKSTLVQAMARCRQATSHYLGQCWPRPMASCGVTKPQWVKQWWCLQVLFWSSQKPMQRSVHSIDIISCKPTKSSCLHRFPLYLPLVWSHCRILLTMGQQCRDLLFSEPEQETVDLRPNGVIWRNPDEYVCPNCDVERCHNHLNQIFIAMEF